jgi:hypothetical protein
MSACILGVDFCFFLYIIDHVGWVAEWLKAPVLKTGKRASVSWVRIPPHPQIFQKFAKYSTYYIGFLYRSGCLTVNKKNDKYTAII